MAAKGKGKVVSHWQTAITDERGESVAMKVPISFTVGDGAFHIPLQTHVVEFLGRSPSFDGRVTTGTKVGYNGLDGEVTAATLDGVKSAHKVVNQLFQDLFRDAGRRKVLLVDFAAEAGDFERHLQLMRDNSLEYMVGSSHMRTGVTPNLQLSYTILWEMGGKLYRVFEGRDGEPARMSYVQEAPSTEKPAHGKRTRFMLDWTQDREDFFKSMRFAIDTLIGRITLMMCGDLVANVDRLIASGGGLLSLPAPDDA